MKIQINKQETYEIRLDKEYSKQSFIQLLERLVNISKMILPQKTVAEGRPNHCGICADCGKIENYLRRGWCLNCYRKNTGLSRTRKTATKEVLIE